MSVAFTLNGARVQCAADSSARLLDVLRDEFGLTGAMEGCGEGECGACTVLIDGAPVCSCLVPVFQVEECAVLTVEGVADGEQLSRIQQALVDSGGVQCGACTPGVVLAAHALLATNSNPDRAAITEALAGNICRCTGYERITRAVLNAAAGAPANVSAEEERGR